MNATRCRSTLATLLLTVAAGNAQAVSFPPVPLETGAQYPPPNVMFILDDSYSMGLNYMPSTDTDLNCDDSSFPGIANDKAMACRTYTKNTLAYNPNIDYQPWLQGDGTRMTARTGYTAASSHLHLVPASSDAINLANAHQTFYVPKSATLTAQQANDKSNYWRYQIRTDGTVVESEWRNNSNGNTNAVETARGCATSGTNWRGCVLETPSPMNRSADAEKANYAIWYSYHRTRMKAAKAGASEAFAALGENLRIGFTNIHADAGSRFNIPVGSDGGLFRGQNKTDWYDKLLAENVPQVAYTPLRTGLAAVGEYYKDSTDTGPWGPAPQLACRQSFAILTTDGFWNKQDEDDAPAAAITALGTIANSDGTAGPNGYVDVPPYADNHAKTLADVAMHYWKNDLRANLDNKVPKSTSDPADWQHMSTFAISIGLEGTISPRTARTTRAGWPDPDPGTGTGKTEGIDDLWHASVNGRGSFVVANNAQDFQRGLLNAFKLVADRTGSASNVAANSTSVTGNTRIYQAKYVSGVWSGDLLAYGASDAGVNATPAWSAAAQLDGATRKFFTWDAGASDGATFPTGAQSTALDASTRVISPATASENVAYLKGSRALEAANGSRLRVRSAVLGDIVNSSPFFVADTNTIYVGANDGMLHAFGSTGAELFAYVPSLVNFADLATLSSTTYAHKYFVDGPVVVTSREQTPGNNYLIGALGRGGKGLFGLDVTTPASFDADDVLWELTDDNLGMVMGEPLIATLNDDDKKVAIVGNGLNSDNGRAVLYVIDIESGDILHELDTGAGGDNGLFAPRGWDNDANGTVDYVYAGDRNGNLWKFDFTGTTPVVANGGNAMFVTASGQPITSGVAIGTDPLTSKRWVFFGTGSFMTATDPADTTVQSVYGIIDDGAAVARADLQQRSILVATTANGNRVRGFPALATLPSGKKGWYLNLDNPANGERVVNRPQVRGTALVFSSRLPPTGDACNAVGAGYLNALDAFSGTSTSSPYMDGNRDGSVNDGDKITSGGVTVPIGSVDLGVGMPTTPTVLDQIIVVGGSSGTLGSVKISPLGGAPRRASWQELPGD